MALPFLTTLDDGSYHVHEEAVELLSSLEGPIATVAVAGLWRTGKSYLLNQLTGNSGPGAHGFVVGATVNACTKGLWIWGKPVELEDGLKVLFIDTEGLGSTSRTQNEDSQIFSLALLLSSFFMWNSRGVIDGNASRTLSSSSTSRSIHVRGTRRAR